jgi:BirA family biotin operon repressor/biotin-[acetyl-CoA-carboxylase] ligase
LVIANRQTAGRGRGNKRWWSGKGAILMSLGFELSPEFLGRDQLPVLSATIARSIMNVLNRYLPQHNIEFHPPNDVYVDGKKICGILLESPTPQYGILGIGLNINNRLSDIPQAFLDDFVDRPITSMIELLGKETDIPRLINELLTEWEGMEPPLIRVR